MNRVGLIVSIALRHHASGSSALARALSRRAHSHPHHRLGTDGDALLARAMAIAVNDRDPRQKDTLSMLLAALERARA